MPSPRIPSRRARNSCVAVAGPRSVGAPGHLRPCSAGQRRGGSCERVPQSPIVVWRDGRNRSSSADPDVSEILCDIVASPDAKMYIFLDHPIPRQTAKGRRLHQLEGHQHWCACSVGLDCSGELTTYGDHALPFRVASASDLSSR